MLWGHSGVAKLSARKRRSKFLMKFKVDVREFNILGRESI